MNGHIPADLQLSAEQILALARTQIADVTGAVERHGVELGMLLAVLVGLIERHEQEAAGIVPGAALSASQDWEKRYAQLALDHQTMLTFKNPLGILRQFYDRLRQRLEHIEQALAQLPAQSPHGKRYFSAAISLFPLEEEREICARVCGVEETVERGPDVELFT